MFFCTFPVLIVTLLSDFGSILTTLIGILLEIPHYHNDKCRYELLVLVLSLVLLAFSTS